MHLLYARFWTKVMADAGIVPFREPFPVLRSQGAMHARDSLTGELRRMSKSAGNVVTPDSVAVMHGRTRCESICYSWPRSRTIPSGTKRGSTARAVSWTESGGWRTKWQGQAGSHGGRPINGSDERLARTVRRTIGRVTGEIERLEFNTAVAALMGCLNVLSDHRAEHGVTPALDRAVREFVLVLAPFAPHIAEELWERLGESPRGSVHYQPWPAWDTAETAEETVTLVLQVDGRVRDRLEVSTSAGEDEVRADSRQSRRAATPERPSACPNRLRAGSLDQCRDKISGPPRNTPRGLSPRPACRRSTWSQRVYPETKAATHSLQVAAQSGRRDSDPRTSCLEGRRSTAELLPQRIPGATPTSSVPRRHDTHI